LGKARYTPFLKLKANEVGAWSELDEEVTKQVIPFFDLPIGKEMDEESFCSMVKKAARKVEKYLGESHPFYLDNFDIPDEIEVGGYPNYEYVIEHFGPMNFIPVVGLDRMDEHNRAVFEAKAKGKIKSDVIALRVLEDDFEEFELVKGQIQILVESGSGLYKDWVLILDCRLCLHVNANEHSKKLARFISAAKSAFVFAEIVVTGSSIPASISEVVGAGQRTELERVELLIFSGLAAFLDIQLLSFGDYTVVSPLYSDVALPPEVLQNIMAPKVIYSYENVHHVARGGALRTHARGHLQYNDIAAYIVAQGFYRTAKYSYGDNFLMEKSKGVGNKVTPGSILKPTINAHITYMVNGHPLLA
jgi:hypothetical protein